MFQVRIHYCILWCNLQWRRTSTVTLACTSHVIGKRPCYWPQTFYIRSCFSTWFRNGTLLQRRKKGENENDIPNVSRRWTRSWLSVSFGLLFILCCTSFFFYFTLKKTHLPCSLVFPSLVDFRSPAGLISLGIRMFTLHGTLFRITGLCLCASYVLAKIIKGVDNILSPIADWWLNKKNWISNLYKEESSLRSKLTKFIKRTLLFSLLCSYNSLLIQYYTHLVYHQLEKRLL